MSKSVTDTWIGVKAAAIGQSTISEVQATPLATLMTWNGRVDLVGGWTRTVSVNYVSRVGKDFVVSGLPTTTYRVKVTLNRAGADAITFTTIVS